MPHCPVAASLTRTLAAVRPATATTEHRHHKGRVDGRSLLGSYAAPPDLVSGSADPERGGHLLILPPLTLDDANVKVIVDRARAALDDLQEIAAPAAPAT
jgi:hypothetical protein